MAETGGKLASEQRRAKLLDAASRMLVENGPEGLSVRKIAAMVDVSTMAIYSTFGSKEGLVTALFDEAFRRLLMAQEHIANLADPVARIHALGVTCRAFAVDNPAYYALIMSMIMPIPETAQVSASEQQHTAPLARSVVHRAAYKRLLDAVVECQAAGLAAPEDPTLITDSLWAAVHGLCSLELAGYYASPEEAEGRFRFALRAMMSGVLTAQGRKRLNQQHHATV